MNDIWITRTPALDDPTGAQIITKAVGGLRLNQRKLCRKNAVVCCLCALCAQFMAETLAAVEPSAPARINVVHPG